jgi:hypothetical protein
VLTDSSTIQTSYIRQLAACTSDTIYTMSMYVKKTIGSQATYPVIFTYFNTTGGAFVTIDATNGIATVWTACTGFTIVTSSAICSSYDANFWRVELTFTANSTNSWGIYFAPAGTTNATQSTGILDITAQGSAVATCFQLEALPMATSYIPTTTATVTRDADVLTFPNAGNVSNTAGTVLMEVTPAFDIPNGSTAGFGYNYLIDFGLSNGVIYTYIDQLRRYDGTTVLTTPSWTPLKNTTYKIGSRYGTAGQRNWLNGTAGTNGAFDGSINSGTNMTIGCYGGTTAYNWGGNIKNLKIYKKALSDAQILIQ